MLSAAALCLLPAALCLLPAAALAVPPPRAFAGTGTDSWIVNGTEAAIGAYPWQGSLLRSGSHTCGCVYIGQDWVLTAAHCVDNASPSTFTVVLGVHDRTDDSVGQPETFGVESMTLHEDWDASGSGFPNDVAVLKMSGTPTSGNGFISSIDMVAPADDDWVLAADDCVISGWGRTNVGSALPNRLLYTQTDVISNEDCNDRMSSISNADVNDGHICVFTNYNGGCNGDSGGPAMCRDSSGTYRLVGITSWIIRSSAGCIVTYPTVYTRISFFREWIQEQTGIH